MRLRKEGSSGTRVGRTHKAREAWAGGMRFMGVSVPLWVAPLSVFLLAFVVYIPTLGHELLNWDDNQYVFDNPYVSGFSARNLRVIWLSTAMPQYYPMVFTSYLFERGIHGGSSRGYHLTNNLLHAVNAVLVFWWAGLLFERREPAWIAALVFALHPIQVESVAWVTERKNVLSVFFFLLALIVYEYWRRREKVGWYRLSLLLYVLALLSKTVVSTGALILAAREVFVGGERSPRGLSRVVPFLLAGIVLGGGTAWIERAKGPFLFTGELGVAKRILIAASAPFFYIEKLILPFGLEPVYPFEEAWAWWRPTRWLALIILAAMVFFLVRRGGRTGRDRILFSATLFLAGVLPVLGLIRFHYQRVSYVANHFAYIPSLAFCFLLGWFLLQLWETSTARWGRWAIAAATGGYLILYGALTWTGCAVWKNSGTLWSRVVEVHPNLAEGHNNLGFWLHTQGRVKEAMREYERAIDLRPAYAEAHNGLALGYMQSGEYVLADEEFRLAAEADPLIADVYSNWGLLKITVKDYAAAERLLRRALELAPDDREIRDNYQWLQNAMRGQAGSDEG